MNSKAHNIDMQTARSVQISEKMTSAPMCESLRWQVPSYEERRHMQVDINWQRSSVCHCRYRWQNTNDHVFIKNIIISILPFYQIHTISSRVSQQPHYNVVNFRDYSGSMYIYTMKRSFCEKASKGRAKLHFPLGQIAMVTVATWL